ncbi:MAG: DUF3226 domain-containing protein [Thermoanaerobaculia bacterium]
MSWILLVEGPDDAHVIDHFLRRRGIDLPTQPKAAGGDTSLLDLFSATVIGGAYRVIAAVIDADSDIGTRWQSLRDRLAQIGYHLPQEPDRQGTIIRGERTVGVWLMPDNRIPGKLENFVELLIPGDDALWPHARAAVASLPQPRRFSTSATIKAEIHTWLAWQKEPGTRMGAAIRQRYLGISGDTADAFAEWVKRLAGADNEE